MPITSESLYNSIEQLKRTINGLATRISDLETTTGIYVTQSTMQTSLEDVNSSITDMNVIVNNLETKLQKISLPGNTRYYLDQSEITDFRNHFRQLRSMMSELEKSRQAFIRLSARYNLTNSSL
ncbi:MAG TPA: hypothetical protein VI911_09910 [Patescibacteria group bacterium]|nr:hypothetical protein [Patescibacteria group bacterium]